MNNKDITIAQQTKELEVHYTHTISTHAHMHTHTDTHIYICTHTQTVQLQLEDQQKCTHNQTERVYECDVIIGLQGRQLRVN